MTELNALENAVISAKLEGLKVYEKQTTDESNKTFLTSGEMSQDPKYLEGGRFYNKSMYEIPFGMVCKDCDKPFGAHVWMDC